MQILISETFGFQREDMNKEKKWKNISIWVIKG